MTHRFPKGYSHPVALGSGGYGSVYRVRQDSLGRLAALKFIVEKKASARALLLKEASMQAQLHLRGVPEVYDVKDMGGSVCIVMQWIRGVSLRDLIGKDLPPGHVAAIITEIIGITAALHEKGYVHRDIKPENIIVSPEGVYFIDFGFSLDVHNNPQRLIDGILKGTPAYCAPELRLSRGDTIDFKRADLYSMGKVIGELTGTEFLPRCIAECLNENPAERPSTAAEVLQAWLSSTGPSVPDWPEIAENRTNNSIADQLLKAAQILLRQRRNEEAYTLLTECITICPECPEAFELMTRFPVIRKNQIALSRLLYAGAALLLLTAGSITTLVYKNLGAVDKTLTSGSRSDERSLFMNSSYATADTINRTLPFKTETGPYENLAGYIDVIEHPADGSLFIDGKQRTVTGGRLTFPTFGRGHHLVWRNTDGTILWKEIITVRPFEVKRIIIRER